MAREVTLTQKQREVFDELVSNGPSNREIGDRLGISEECVKAHLRRAMAAADCENRTELAVKYFRGIFVLT